MALTSVIAGVLSIVLSVIAWLGVKFGIYFTCVVVRMAKLHSASPRAIFAILTTTLVKFIPNFTPSHAITYTNTSEPSLEALLLLTNHNDYCSV